MVITLLLTFAAGVFVGGSTVLVYFARLMQEVTDTCVDAARHAGADAERFQSYLRKNADFYDS